MKRPVMIHATLLAAGLCAAYLTWTREPTGAEDEVQIVSLRGGLDRVVYESEDRKVEVERRKDDRGSYHWLRVETWETPPPPPSPPAPVPAPAPTPAPGSTDAPDTKAEPKKAEPKKPEPKKAEPKKAEPKKAEPKKAEPKKPEPKKAEPKKAATKDSLDKDPKAEPKKAEPKKPEPKKPEPKKPEPKKPEPKKPEPKKAEPEAKRPDAPAPAPIPTLTPPPRKDLPKVKKVQEFKGSKSADELMKGLAILSAVRSLGAVTEAEKLKAFGLEGSKKTLTLVSGSTPRVFVIGGNTYGNMDTYLQDKQDGRVYVVRPRLLQDFLYAEFRLVDRMLHAFDPVEVERATVTAVAGKKELVQQNRRDPAGAYWAEAATPEKRKDFYRNWMAKTMRLSGLEYLPPEKKLDGHKLLATIEYFGGGKQLGQLRLYKHTSLVPKVAGSTDLGAGDYYAISENSRAMVKLSRPIGEEIERDIPNLMKE